MAHARVMRYIGLPLLLTAFLVMVFRDHMAPDSLAVSAGYFLVLVLVLFCIGRQEVATQLRTWIGESAVRVLIAPIVMALLFYSYVLYGGADPFQGTGWWLPLFYGAPALYFLKVRRNARAHIAYDVVGVGLCMLPFIFGSPPVASYLPAYGAGLGSVFRMLMVISAVYALVVVRGLPNVGFEPVLRWRALGLVILAWLAFVAVAAAISFPTGFAWYVGYEELTASSLVAGLAVVLKKFIHTALPEELMFRGVFQNLLEQGMRRSGGWQLYFGFAFIVLAVLSGWAGYRAGGQFPWLPSLVAVSLFAVAYLRVRRFGAPPEAYTALAVISAVFGVIHLGKGPDVFVGLAMLAGWLYGYVYMKTRNVFYAAVLHELVNISPVIFGIAVAR